MSFFKSVKDFFQYMTFSWEKPTEIFLGETKYLYTVFRSDVDSRFQKKMNDKGLDDEELANDTIWRIDAKYKAVTVFCHVKAPYKVPDKRELEYCISNFFDDDNIILAESPYTKRQPDGSILIGDTNFGSNGDGIESFIEYDEKGIRLKISSPYKIETS